MNNTNQGIQYDIENCIINVIKYRDLQVYLAPTLLGSIRLCVSYNLMNIINWCIGKDLELLNRCLRIITWYLVNEYDDLYDEKIPFCSLIKPINKDEHFMFMLSNLESKVPEYYKFDKISNEQVQKLITIMLSNFTQNETKE